MHEEKRTKQKEAESVPEGAIPAYLMDRSVSVVCIANSHVQREADCWQSA